MPSLVVERGREKGANFQLEPGSALVVGRDPTAQLVISDPGASRRHFQIESRNGRWLLSDLGSKNHTFLNEERVERDHELQPGDRIQVGETVFSFLADDDRSDAGGKAGGLTGKELGGYRILERIGRGGMGTVFKAKQISLNRVVAFKVLSSKFARDPVFIERFLSEARAAGQLTHPNVVQVFDVGQSGGLHFISMELMEGGAVQDLLSAREDSRLPWQEALPMVLDAARGLVYAERRGIIHRDIKPDNLMLTSEMKVKIGDLGLAKKADEAGDTKIFGTPHFIAPEQALGKDVTHSADIYSLGATFYRMVAGKTPFSGDTVKEILRKQVNDPPEPVQRLVQDFPEDLAAILDRMMAKKPEERYQSAQQLVQDLEAFQLAHHIEMAGGVKSRKPLLVAMGVLFLALVSVIAWIATRPEPEQVDPLVITRTVVERDPGTAPDPAAEAERRRERAEFAAQSAILDLERKALQLGPEPALDKRDAWSSLADEYQKLAREHADAPKAAATASERAVDILDALNKRQREWDLTKGAARTWWERQRARIAPLETEGRYRAAAEQSESLLAGAEWKTHGPHLADLEPAPESWLRGMADRVFAAAAAKQQEELEAARALIDDQHAGEGILRAEQWIARLRENRLEGERWDRLAQDASAWVEERRSSITAQLEEDLEADRLAFVERYRQVRRRPAQRGAGGGPAFAFRFGEGAQTFEALPDVLRTWLFDERAARKADQYRRMQAGWEGFTKLLSEGKLFTAEEELKGLPGVVQGSRITLDLSRPCTADTLCILVQVTGGSAANSRAWSELTPAQVFDIVVRPKIDKLPGQTAYDLALIFAELGHPEAQALKERAFRERAGVSPEDDRWLAREAAAIQDYRKLLEVAPTTPPQQLMRLIEDWRRRHFRSDFALLVDGRPAAEIAQVFTDEEQRAFLESWGAKPQ